MTFDDIPEFVSVYDQLDGMTVWYGEDSGFIFVCENDAMGMSKKVFLSFPSVAEYESFLHR